MLMIGQFALPSVQNGFKLTISGRSPSSEIFGGFLKPHELRDRCLPSTIQFLLQLLSPYTVKNKFLKDEKLLELISYQLEVGRQIEESDPYVSSRTMAGLILDIPGSGKKMWVL